MCSKSLCFMHAAINDNFKKRLLQDTAKIGMIFAMNKKTDN